MTSPSSHQRSVSRYQLNGKIHPIILYRWMARERERGMIKKRETKRDKDRDKVIDTQSVEREGGILYIYIFRVV